LATGSQHKRKSTASGLYKCEYGHIDMYWR